jgi:hypothetical protein
MHETGASIGQRIEIGCRNSPTPPQNNGLAKNNTYSR